MNERGVVQEAGSSLLDRLGACEADPDLVSELEQLLEGEFVELVLRYLCGGLVMRW